MEKIAILANSPKNFQNSWIDIVWNDRSEEDTPASIRSRLIGRCQSLESFQHRREMFKFRIGKIERFKGVIAAGFNAPRLPLEIGPPFTHKQCAEIGKIAHLVIQADGCHIIRG